MIPSLLYLLYESFILMVLHVISIFPPYEQLLVGSMGKTFCWPVFAITEVEQDNAINASIDSTLYLVCICSPTLFCMHNPLSIFKMTKFSCLWRNLYHCNFCFLSLIPFGLFSGLRDYLQFLSPPHSHNNSLLMVKSNRSTIKKRPGIFIILRQNRLISIHQSIRLHNKSKILPFPFLIVLK